MSNTAIDPKKVISFPQGIPGFEDITKYRVSHKEVDGTYAYWLESCDRPGIDFTLLDPVDCGLHYDLKLNDDEQNLIGATAAENLAVFLVIREGDDETSGINANVGGPIIINTTKQLGMQKVINHARRIATIVSE
ncbi:MAG: flagellar assembly protein FliW [Desulfotalea sp.]